MPDEADSAQAFEDMATQLACARSAGARCRRVGMAITANPYDEGTPLAGAWRGAWWAEDEKRKAQTAKR